MFYNKLFQKIIFQISERASGTSILRYLDFLEKSQYWPRKEIEKYQFKRLKLLLEHAYDNVPYYHELFDKIKFDYKKLKSLNDLKRIPFLTKELIKKRNEDLRATNYIDKSYPTFTSGSTGTPTRFFQTM